MLQISLAIVIVLCLAVIFWLVQRVIQLQADSAEQVRQKQATLTLLDKIGESLTSELEIDPALESIADYIIHATDAEAGAVFLISHGQDSGSGAGGSSFLTARVVRGLFPPLRDTSGYVLTKRRYLVEKVKKDTIQIGEGIIGWVAEHGAPILIEDCQSDPRVPRVASDFLTMNTLMAAPLRARGQTLGVFALVNKRGAGAFDEADMNLLQALTDQAALAVDLVGLVDEVAKIQRLEQELRIAHEFQAMLLPKQCPDIPGFELAALSHPAQEIGGDFYDFIPLGDSCLGIVIADVSGKGIPAALVMAAACSTLRAEAIALKGSPRAVLRRLNDRILKDTKSNVFITMTYGVLDPQRQTFCFARAGHEPLLICGAEGEDPMQHVPSGIAIGMVEPEMFDLIEEKEIQFNPGETAVLYTDGIVEAMNERNDEFGHARLFDSLTSRAGGEIEKMIAGVVEDLDAFRKSVPRPDDITLVAIRFDGTSPKQADSSAADSAVSAPGA